jgi:potassium-transporting ATPase KdpC subunit
LLLTLLTGVVYPLLVTVIAQSVFPRQSQGSLIEPDGVCVGSELIGQNFDDPKYFWGRLSATTTPSAADPDKSIALPYNAGSSSGSNLGPSNPDLVKAVKERIEKLQAADPTNKSPIPVDLVTSSASGLDPHISPAAAEYQVPRVAKARGMSETAVRQVVEKHTQSRTFGVLGEPRVNVLELNLDLDSVKVQ